MEVVAVLGASNDSSRYSWQAMNMLKEFGHKPLPVHPRETEVLGEKVFKTLGELALSGQKVDTITVYVNAAISDKFLNDFIAIHPRRVIFNPGAENPSLAQSLKEQGIQVENACTLVLLRTGQY